MHIESTQVNYNKTCMLTSNLKKKKLCLCPDCQHEPLSLLCWLHLLTISLTSNVTESKTGAINKLSEIKNLVPTSVTHPHLDCVNSTTHYNMGCPCRNSDTCISGIIVINLQFNFLVLSCRSLPCIEQHVLAHFIHEILPYTLI